MRVHASLFFEAGIACLIGHRLTDEVWNEDLHNDAHYTLIREEA